VILSRKEVLKGILATGFAGSLAASGFPISRNARAETAGEDIALIPSPYEVRKLGKTYPLDTGGIISYNDPVIEKSVDIFTEKLRSFSKVGLGSERESDGKLPKSAIRLEIGPTPEVHHLPNAIGISPAANDDLDERYFLRVDDGGILIRAQSPEGVAMGLNTLLQMLLTTPQNNPDRISIPYLEIVDGPQYKWRNFTLDTVRHHFDVKEVKTVIDLVSFYKFNSFVLPLTDDDSFLIEATRPAGKQLDDLPFNTRAELDEIVKYARDRFIVVIPFADAPAHATAIMKLHPELNTGNNFQEVAMPPYGVKRSAWLNPDLPATFRVYDEIIAYLAEVFPANGSTSAATSLLACPMTSMRNSSNISKRWFWRRGERFWHARKRCAPVSIATSLLSTGCYPTIPNSRRRCSQK
jgi:hexosaminidase